MSKSEIVSELFIACLFLPDEPRDGAVMVEGVTVNVGFHPGRLAERKEAIRDIAKQIVADEFLVNSGGGWSFLNLATDRDGDTWGEHHNFQELMLLCIGAGLAKYLLPRIAWRILPGGMPYVAFDL